MSVHSKRLCQRLSNYVISQQSPLLQNVQILRKSNYYSKRFSITKRKVDQLSELTLVCISIIAIVKLSVFLSQLLATGVHIPGYCLFPCSWQKAKISEKVFSLNVINQYFSLFIEWLLHFSSFNIRDHDIYQTRQRMESPFTQSFTKVSFIAHLSLPWSNG